MCFKMIRMIRIEIPEKKKERKKKSKPGNSNNNYRSSSSSSVNCTDQSVVDLTNITAIIIITTSALGFF